jgi:hypothetical protein
MPDGFVSGDLQPAEIATLPTGPVGYWTLNNTLAAVVGDPLVVGAGSVLAGVSPVVSSDDVRSTYFNNALRLNNAAHNAALTLTGAWSAIVMVYPTIIQTSNPAILVHFASSGTDTDPANNTCWGLGLDPTNRFRYDSEHGAGVNDTWLSDVVIPVGQWSHIGVTRNVAGTDLILYLNGVARASTTITAPTGGTNCILYIGGLPVVSVYYTGMMFTPEIFDRTLTPAEVLAAANQQLPPELRPNP